MTAALRASVTSLHIRNYRRYFVGQVVSLSGNWMQIVAETWLVLHLTGSGTAVGFAAALQFLPILLAGAWGGLIADRMDKRRLLMVTQGAMAVPSLALWALAATGSAQLWMVFGLILARGAVNALDNPARQSFVWEMVGPDRVVNAVSLNSVLVHCARLAGPAAAAGVIALWGVAPCFALNALTFGVMFLALRGMEPEALQVADKAPREPGQLRLALRYVKATPALWIPLALMAWVGTLAFNFQVLLPLLARFTFGGDAASYAGLMAAMAVGSIAGALIGGARGRTGLTLLARSAAAFGALTLLVAAAPSYAVALALLVPLGAASVTFAAGVNSTLQLAVEGSMRGRVMALYSVVFLGSTPFGAPLVGWLAEVVSPRAGLALGGLAAVTGALAAWTAARRLGAAPEASGAPVRSPGDVHLRRARRASRGRVADAGVVRAAGSRLRDRLPGHGGDHHGGARGRVGVRDRPGRLRG